jgi:plastocyanin
MQADETTDPSQATILGFILPDITVPVGTKVTWTQRDNTPHTTTSGTDGQYDDIGWDSPILGENETFNHTFNEVGTFAYTCRLHPYMSGTVTVTDGSSDGDTSTSDDASSGDDDPPVVDDPLSDDYY